MRLSIFKRSDVGCISWWGCWFIAACTLYISGAALPGRYIPVRLFWPWGLLRWASFIYYCWAQFAAPVLVTFFTSLSQSSIALAVLTNIGSTII